jgi:hypothetical protein
MATSSSFTCFHSSHSKIKFFEVSDISFRNSNFFLCEHDPLPVACHRVGRIGNFRCFSFSKCTCDSGNFRRSFIIVRKYATRTTRDTHREWNRKDKTQGSLSSRSTILERSLLSQPRIEDDSRNLFDIFVFSESPIDINHRTIFDLLPFCIAVTTLLLSLITWWLTIWINSIVDALFSIGRERSRTFSKSQPSPLNFRPCPIEAWNESARNLGDK